MADCPACAEPISLGTEVCPHCGIRVREYLPGGGVARETKSSGLLLALLIGGGALVLLLMCGGVMTALTLPAVQQAREAARRSQCKNNLKQIGLALHNYHELNGCFPPAYIADESGKPMHSWRILILPQLGEMNLYNQYDFAEPWDGPKNSRLLSMMPAVYACPSHQQAGATTTSYAGVFGPNSSFRGSQPVTLPEMTDGPANTLMVGETTAGIPWMQPVDVDIAVHPTIGDVDGFHSDHLGGVHFLFGDGGVRFVANGTAAAGMYTISGNEPVAAPF